MKIGNWKLTLLKVLSLDKNIEEQVKLIQKLFLVGSTFGLLYSFYFIIPLIFLVLVSIEYKGELETDENEEDFE